MPEAAGPPRWSPLRYAGNLARSSGRPLLTAPLPRRRFLATLGAATLAAPIALALPRLAAAEVTPGAEIDGECRLEGRDTRPHKGFASTRPGSGGQCTTHAARRFDTVAPEPGVNWMGNAKYWYANAAAAGWMVGSDLHEARPGAVVVWDGNAGHVAFVEAVMSEGIYVSEMNWSQRACSWSTRFRTSAWGRVGYAFLPWEEVQSRLGHRFIGYVYPMRRELTDL
jgi:hypothetical protein